MTSSTVEEASDKLHELDQKINDFFGKVNDVLSWVPGFLSDLIQPIEDGLESLRQTGKR